MFCHFCFKEAWEASMVQGRNCAICLECAELVVELLRHRASPEWAETTGSVERSEIAWDGVAGAPTKRESPDIKD